MLSIEKRLIELERSAQREQTTIVIRFDESEATKSEAMGLEVLGGGQSWSRAADESEADFIQRASKEAQRTKGFATLMQTFKEDNHAQA